MFLGILNTILFSLSNNPFHLELNIHSTEIVVIMSFVVLSNVGIKRVDCTSCFKCSCVTCNRMRHTTIACKDPFCLNNLKSI